MKFAFKIQQYQTDAVKSVVDVFSGQPFSDFMFRHDIGESKYGQLDYNESGYANNPIQLSDIELLDNIKKIQNKNSIVESSKLSRESGVLNLDVEMETGTGKTYVYIKTMFELKRKYGWSKYIIVVPNLAIREGVAKSIEMLEEHFMQDPNYNEKINYFIYDSSNLHLIDDFSTGSGINVMIINYQAFATKTKGNEAKEVRIIKEVRDDFQSRRPIDVIAATNPIIIKDEPQHLSSKNIIDNIKEFKPLLILNYSATHKTIHNTVYSLDPLDAFDQKLVKKINVKGFATKNIKGLDSYLYLDSFILSPNKPPRVRIELEVMTKSGVIKRQLKTFSYKDNLEEESKLKAYEGFIIDEIDPRDEGVVKFLNGAQIIKGEMVNLSLKPLQRAQIRETIKSHFEKERDLFKRGIKCLSLFFIDEVSHYRAYDDEGKEVKGEFQEIFEEEYNDLVQDEIKASNDTYSEYLKKQITSQAHTGYFSIDKHNRAINTKANAKGDNDRQAFDLILKDKERLLSFEEPTRFIFSHSALSEGWDNPNVFQICFLRHTDSSIKKRQEVGRGLRLCVNDHGIRQDSETLGDSIFDVNTLTVIANESYKDFVDALQKETKDGFRERPKVVSSDLFKGKTYTQQDGSKCKISDIEISRILVYLTDNGYINEVGLVSPEFRKDLANGGLRNLPDEIKSLNGFIVDTVKGVFDNSLNDDRISKCKNKSTLNKLNNNFYKKEFQDLWKRINSKYYYEVSYFSEELIRNDVNAINEDLFVSKTFYEVKEGHQVKADEFATNVNGSHVVEMNNYSLSHQKYDLVGDIAKGANITRRSVVQILKQIKNKLSLFKDNPEEFIQKVVKIIKEQKATMIVNHIVYHKSEQKYNSDIFCLKSREDFPKIKENCTKHVTDMIVWDSNVENEFADSLEENQEVEVYAKLPRAFKIPTPVGDYAPDWAIVLNIKNQKHIYFIAETKGTLNSMDLKAIENYKIKCSSKLFESLDVIRNITDAKVIYHQVKDWKSMYDIITEKSATNII